MTEFVGSGFSVVVPAYGPTPHLAKLVHCLINQTPSPVKIVVVHTGSDDPTDELAVLAERSPLPVQVIHEDGRRYAGSARNRGVAHVETPWVAFLDCDVVPAPDYCAAVARAIQETEADCFVGAIEPASTGGYWGLCMWFIECGSVHPYLPARPMQTGPGASMVARRETLVKVGGFPSDMSVGEDAVCQLRIREQAGDLLFVPAIRIGHHMVGGFSSYRRHLMPLGAAAARVRIMYALKGSRAAANPLLASGLWLARAGQIGLRVARYGRGERLRFVALLPGILLGLLVWNWGFLRYLLTSTAPGWDPEVDPAALQTWRSETKSRRHRDRVSAAEVDRRR